MTADTIRREIQRIEKLATLPQIAFEILEVMRNTNASMRKIAGVIEKDPSITAKIIKVSNSPMWGFAGRVDNVQKALVLLGLKQVTNIVIAVSLYSTFARLPGNPYFDREKFWMHSVGTGQIARRFAKKIGLNFHGEEFVAALIHDLGKMLLDQFYGDLFQNILETAQKTGDPILEVEQKFLGCTHADLGGWLLQHWNFPISIVTAVQYHHQPAEAPNHQSLTSVIHLSEILCELWGIGFDGDIRVACLEDDPAWTILKQNNPQLYRLDLERFTFELNQDMENAEIFIKLIRD